MAPGDPILPSPPGSSWSLGKHRSPSPKKEPSSGFGDRDWDRGTRGAGFGRSSQAELLWAQPGCEIRSYTWPAHRPRAMQQLLLPKPTRGGCGHHVEQGPVCPAWSKVPLCRAPWGHPAPPPPSQPRSRALDVPARLFRAETYEPVSVRAETPKEHASCRVGVVFLDVAKPWEPPDEQAAPPGGAERTPRICGAHDTRLNHSLRGLLPTCLDEQGVLMRSRKTVAMVMECFACVAEGAEVSRSKYEQPPQPQGGPAGGNWCPRWGSSLRPGGSWGSCQKTPSSFLAQTSRIGKFSSKKKLKKKINRKKPP